MKRGQLLILIFVLTLSQVTAQQQGMVLKKNNYSGFSSVRNFTDAEVLQFNKGFEQHPEIGQLFAETPCEDCFEVIEKRTSNTKYFIKKGTNGTHVYEQTSFDPMHIKDALGNDKTVISALQPNTTIAGLYTALQQPIPVGIHTSERFSFLGSENQRFYFNRQLVLVFIPNGGEEQVVGPANWNNYTAGDDGIYITDAWPGIDMEMAVARGQVKTNYIIKNQLPQFANGQLRIRDQLLTDQGLSINALGKNEFNGEIQVVDQSQNVLFFIQPAVVYDQQVRENGKTPLNYELKGAQLDIIIPQEWINKDPGAYPITIDPLVSGTANMAIAGSGYNATCFTGGCVYNLPVAVPAAITVSDIRWSFNYTATNPCYLSDGAVTFQLGGCVSPNAAGFFWFCNLGSPGTCTGNNISIFSDLQPCVPAPNCASYNMNLSMKFYRCYSSGAGCSNSCIGAATPWTMVVEGHTVEPTSLVTVLPAVTICQGSSTTLTATGQNGVPGYTYTWNPGALAGTPSVSPAASTNYTVTITDACGNTTTATKQVNVTLSNNPGFTIVPNPVCQGQPVTITGLGAGAAANYDWLLPSSSNPVVNNTKTFNVTYASSGSFPITLNFTSGACVFPLVQNVTVNPTVVPTINIVAAPAGPYCPGANITFTANITNGGGAPVYQWQVNGANVGTNSNTYSTTALNAGDVVTCTLTSNAPCASPTVVVSNSIAPVIVASLLPTINIVAAPAGPICAGTNVTFTANITNGGSAPTYQWQVNGANVGTNSNSFSTSTLTNGNTVTCILTSNDPCASPATVSSNSIVMTVNPVVIPTINIVAAPAGSICAGTNVTFTANITNGGGAPVYQWQVNGTNVGANSNTYSSNALNNGDVVTCTLTSNAPCASPVTVTSNNIVMVVNPVLVPTINIVAVPAGPVCSGTNVTFTANITNGGAAPAYQWQVNGTNVGSNSNTYSSAALNNGDVVTCTLTSNALCASPTNVISNNIVMTIIPTVIPTVNIVAAPAGPICAGTNVTFTANITNGGAAPVYQWQVNGSNVGTNSNTFSSSTLNNADVVTVTLTSNAPCAAPANVISNNIAMVVNPLVTPTIAIVSNPGMPVCLGANITFTANITNGGAAPTYQWQVNGANVGGNSNTFSSATLIGGDVVTCTLTSNAACLAAPTANSNNIVISNFPAVTISVSPDAAICEQEIITLTATPANGNPALYNVVWQPLNVGGNSITLSPNSTTTYTATVTDQCGSTASSTVTVTVNPQPVASFTFLPNPADLANQPTSFTDASTNAVSWFWNFGNGNTANSQNSSFGFTTAGIFPVILIVTSANGCTDTTIAQLVFESSSSLFIPSGFTPNNDDINPIFFAYGTGITSFSMLIYTRWGEEVFVSDNLDKGWNGMFKSGNPAPEGVYDYKVDVKFTNNTTQTVMGKLTLIR
jgi:gliding motility-associated-like protein